MAQPTVLFAGPQFPAARRALSEVLPEASVIVFDAAYESPSAEVLIPLMARIDGAAMDRVVGLRLIQQWGAGLEGVDVAAATARGIAVGNVTTTETGNAESVAEWCVMAALALARNLGEAGRAIRAGDTWGYPLGRSLLGSTVGIIGLGGIGTALARRLGPFGVELIGVTAHPNASRAAACGLAWLGGSDRLGEVLDVADYVVLCLPLGPETYHLIGEMELAAMRPSAFLINPGRGGLVDEAALITALRAGQLAGAALDVFAREPLDPASPLLAMPNVLATPHIAGVTDRSYHGNAVRVAEAITRLASGAPLAHCVNWTEVERSFYRNR